MQLVAVAASVPHVAVPAVTVYPVTDDPTDPVAMTGAAQLTAIEPLDVEVRLLITGADEGVVHFEVFDGPAVAPSDWLATLYALKLVTVTAYTLEPVHTA